MVYNIKIELFQKLILAHHKYLVYTLLIKCYIPTIDTYSLYIEFHSFLKGARNLFIDFVYNSSMVTNHYNQNEYNQNKIPYN